MHRRKTRAKLEADQQHRTPTAGGAPRRWLRARVTPQKRSHFTEEPMLLGARLGLNRGWKRAHARRRGKVTASTSHFHLIVTRSQRCHLHQTSRPKSTRQHHRVRSSSGHVCRCFCPAHCGQSELPSWRPTPDATGLTTLASTANRDTPRKANAHELDAAHVDVVLHARSSFLTRQVVEHCCSIDSKFIEEDARGGKTQKCESYGKIIYRGHSRDGSDRRRSLQQQPNPRSWHAWAPTRRLPRKKSTDSLVWTSARWAAARVKTTSEGKRPAVASFSEARRRRSAATSMCAWVTGNVYTPAMSFIIAILAAYWWLCALNTVFCGPSARHKRVGVGST